MNLTQRLSTVSLLACAAALAAFAAAGESTSAITQAQPASVVYNVKSFGATGNGTTLATPAINKAIETAAKAGGGTVYLPAGTYLCFSIHLQSNITLYLDAGATILAAAPIQANASFRIEGIRP